MKGLILSGGKGTRLRPITFTRAKQLLPVANKPILFYGIEAIRDAGIRDIGIVIGDTGDEIREAVGDGSRWGVRVTYIPQEAPLGLAHAVKIAEPYLEKASFVMYLGDNLILGGIRDLVSEFERGRPHCQILLARVPNPSQFGVAELRDGRVVSLVEKPREPRSDLALVGVYLFDSRIFEAVGAIRPSARGELEITDAIQYLIDRGYDVHPHMVNGWWKDTGRLEDILEANRMVLDALESRVEGDVDSASHIDFKVVIEKGARVEKSTIRGPAIIGEGAHIVNSYIGSFTSIARDVLIKDSEIDHSIVLDGSRIVDIPRRIEGSLIGRNAEVTRSHLKPKAYRLMLGDNSEVTINL